MAARSALLLLAGTSSVMGYKRVLLTDVQARDLLSLFRQSCLAESSLDTEHEHFLALMMVHRC